MDHEVLQNTGRDLITLLNVLIRIEKLPIRYVHQLRFQMRERTIFLEDQCVGHFNWLKQTDIPIFRWTALPYVFPDYRYNKQNALRPHFRLSLSEYDRPCLKIPSDFWTPAFQSFFAQCQFSKDPEHLGHILLSQAQLTEHYVGPTYHALEFANPFIGIAFGEYLSEHCPFEVPEAYLV